MGHLQSLAVLLRSRRPVPQRIRCEYKLLNRTPADQMLLNDPLQNLGSRGVIPNAFRIDDGNGSTLADAEAVRFRAIGDVLALGEAQLAQAALQIIPCRHVNLVRSALRIRLFGT